MGQVPEPALARSGAWDEEAGAEARPTVSMPAETGTSRSLLYPWFMVGFMMVLLTSSFIDRTILGLLVKPIRSDLHISDTEFSYLSGLAFVVLYTTAGIPLGWVADRWNRRLLITVGVALWSVMTAACGVVGSYWPLFTTRIGVGIGESTLSPCSYSMISDYFPSDRLARAMSIFTMGIPIGSGLAMIIGGGVIEAITAIGPVDLPVVGITRPWQSVFLIIGLPGLLLAALAALIIREPPHRKARTAPQPSFGDVIRYMWRHRSVYATLALSLGCFAAFSYGGTVWFPPFLMRVQGFGPGGAGLFIGLSTLVLGVIGSLASGWIADRLMRRGRRDGLMLVGIAYALGLFACAAIGPIVPVRWLSLALFAGTGFFSLTWAGTNISTLQTVTPANMRGQVSAIYLFTTNTIGLGLGPTAIAASTDHIFHNDQAVGYSLAIVGTVSMALGSLILWLGRRAVARRLDEVLSASRNPP